MRGALAGLVLFAACSSELAQLRKDLGPRASGTLECREEELHYFEAEKIFSTTKVRVTGCGREVVYKLVESRWERDREAEGGNR